jgi:hypothetical protein
VGAQLQHLAEAIQVTIEAWLWATLLSGVAWALGYRTGVSRACRVFAALLIQFGLWDQYRAASERHERGNP